MYLILQDHTGYSSKVASPSCILFVCLVVVVFFAYKANQNCSIELGYLPIYQNLQALILNHTPDV